MKKCLIISLITILLILGALVTPVKAASGSVGISSTSVTVGNKVSVTIYFGDKVKAAQCTVNYDTNKFTYDNISGGAQFNPSDHTVVYLNASYKADLSSVTLSFIANATGTANFSVSGLKVATATQTNITPPMANLAVSTTVNPKPDPKPPVTDPDKPNGGNNGGGTSKPNDSNSNTTTKKPTFTNKTATVYAKETVSIRDSWSTSGKLLGTLQKGKSITRTGIGSNGWDRVNYNGKVAYISSQYLTTTKPKDDKKDDDKDNDKNNTTNNENNNTTNNETANNVINNVTNNEENSEVNNASNELTNNEHQGSNAVNNEKKDNKNYIEFIIIGVIILAIIVIIVSEISAKKKSKKKGRK